MTKRLLSVMLALIMIVGIVPASAVSSQSASVIKEVNATVGSDITMNFYVDIPEGSEDKYTFKTTLDGAENIVVPVKKNGEYVISVTSINPQQMGDTITVNVMEGDKSIQEISISVKDYLDRVVAENSELTTLCSDMLAFGSAAQEYLGYKTDSLANKNVEWYAPTEGINEAAVLANTDKDLSGNTEKGIGGAGVILGSYNYVYFNVNADDIAKENVVLTAGEKSVTDYEIVKKSGKLQIVTPALKATDNGTVFTLTVNIGGKESTVSYSVNAYIKAKYNNADTKLVNLIKALYNYGASSDAYASTPALVVDKVTSAKGGTAEVSIALKNNPGLLGITFKIGYDSANLTLADSEEGSALPDLELIEPGKYKNGCAFTWYGKDVDTIMDGTILTLTFIVSDTAPSGIYPVTVSYTEGDVIGADKNNVDLTVVNGSITVS